MEQGLRVDLFGRRSVNQVMRNTGDSPDRVGGGHTNTCEGSDMHFFLLARIRNNVPVVYESSVGRGIGLHADGFVKACELYSCSCLRTSQYFKLKVVGSISVHVE